MDRETLMFCVDMATRNAMPGTSTQQILESAEQIRNFISGPVVRRTSHPNTQTQAS